jgi:hypothetical protein
MLNDGSTIAEKLAYMRACRAGGIRSLALHPRAGNLIPYASSEWFEMVRAIVAEAGRLDMKIWLYDEDPFPSGAAGGMVTLQRPDLRARNLVRLSKPKDIKVGDLWLISPLRILWAGLVPVKKVQPAKDLTHLVGLVRCDWFFTGWDSRYYYETSECFPCERGSAISPRSAMRVPEIPAGYELIALAVDFPGAEGSWNDLPDLLNPETFDLFCSLTLEPYRKHVGRHFGKRIPGIFTDEAKPHGNVPITDDLFASFKAGAGYDISPRLYQLFCDPLNEEYMETRIAYRRWVGERFLDAFVRPYARYCRQYNLLLVGHFSPEDDPIHEAHSIVSVMPIMKEQGMPGTDVIVPGVGHSNAPALNVGSLRASSVRSQNGHRYCMSESLALAEWSVTSQQVRHLLAWQKVLGIDRFFPHGCFQTIEGVTRFEAPPGYGPESSIFPGYGQVEAWLDGCEKQMDGAAEVAEVAILNPITTYLAQGVGASLSEVEELRSAFWKISVNCLRTQVGFHFADEPDLAKAKSRKGLLQIGQWSYSTLLVPMIEIIPQPVLNTLQQAVKNGVRVVWFGGGPKRVFDLRNRLRYLPAKGLPGQVVTSAQPSEAWLRRNLPRQVILSGTDRSDCYVRRFKSVRGSVQLFAVNVGKKDLAVSIACEPDGRSWQSAEGMVTGEVAATRQGTRIFLPAQGSAMLELKKASIPFVPSTSLRLETGASREFRRLQANVLRLDSCTVRRDNDPKEVLKYPQPYFQITDDYSASTMAQNFAGPIPLVSTIQSRTFTYGFAINAKTGLDARLLLQPRGVRGRFRLFLNSRPLGNNHYYPCEGGSRKRVRLRLKKGSNSLAFRFEAENAMDGLLGPLFLEGDFDVSRVGDGFHLSNSIPQDSRTGWQEAGLPHYMGAGEYTWTESLPSGSTLSGWRLELDQVVDSAELFVNGRSCDRRAWGPWRWQLPKLKKAENRFRLVVSSTAGNRLALICPNQAQGWIGKAYLVQ